MIIKGPITITIEGPQGSRKTTVSTLIEKLLRQHNLSVDIYHENDKVKNRGQTITIIDRQL